MEPPHRAASPRCGGANNNVTAEDGSHVTFSLERFVREMEARQNETIDAALDVTGSSSKGAVKLVEEACWGSVMEADKDADSLDTATGAGTWKGLLERFVRKMEATHEEAIDATLNVTGSSDKCTVGLVEEARCSKCDRRFYTKSGHHVCVDCRDKCPSCNVGFYSPSGMKVCVDCRR